MSRTTERLFLAACATGLVLIVGITILDAGAKTVAAITDRLGCELAAPGACK